MREKTKAQINKIARLIYAEMFPLLANGVASEYDFSDSYTEASIKAWNTALIAYAEFKQEYGLLRYKIKG